MGFGRRWFLGNAVTAPGAAWAANSSRRVSAVEKSLAAGLADVRLFNAHEHLIPEKERVSQAVDFFTLAGHYAITDVISAGLGGDALAAVNDSKTPMEQRWKAFEPHWRAARFTGYGQALSIAIADIYDAREISAASLGQINQAIAKRNKPGLYDYVLRDRAKIDWCLGILTGARSPRRWTGSTSCCPRDSTDSLRHPPGRTSRLSRKSPACRSSRLPA